ncbi:CtsR family transcriptional regulator [Latilactobacillus sakei]|uniref:CtsR family transcriptional regulator n=1 Tax=Latilactobacillus sakei TaxID=1599 RepID=UPI003D9A6543
MIYLQSQNISDIIEAYLKKILADSEQIEIRRSEIAKLFNCVPSQINYVINTRFTEQRGMSSIVSVAGAATFASLRFNS